MERFSLADEVLTCRPRPKEALMERGGIGRPLSEAKMKRVLSRIPRRSLASWVSAPSQFDLLALACHEALAELPLTLLFNSRQEFVVVLRVVMDES